MQVAHIATHTDQSTFLRSIAYLAPFYQCSITNDRDNGELKWRWTATREYTTASAYEVMHNSGILYRYHTTLWKLRAPMKVAIFIWLTLQNKILTQQILETRGCNIVPSCTLCRMNLLETKDHILWSCIFAKAFWTELLRRINIPYPTGTCATINKAW